MFGSLLTSTDGSFDGRPFEGVARPSVETTLWLVVLASVTLDVYTTAWGLSLGLSEGNPLMRRAMDGGGIAALGAAKVLVVAAAAGIRTLRPRYGTTIALGLALPWTLTVLINAVTLATV